MPITPISIAGITWEEGDPGNALRPKGADVYVTGNPAGGDPGVVLVLNRSTQFPLSVRGCFNEDAVPDVYAWKGTSVAVVRFGVTIQCVVIDARVLSRTTALDQNVARTSLAVAFELIDEGAA